MKGKSLAIVALWVFSVASSNADIVQLPLDCAGIYDLNTPAWTLDFDLGVTFTDISHVYIDWSGDITGGLATDPYTPGDPFPIDVEIGAYLGNSPNWRHTTVQGGRQPIQTRNHSTCSPSFSTAVCPGLSFSTGKVKSRSSIWNCLSLVAT